MRVEQLSLSSSEQCIPEHILKSNCYTIEAKEQHIPSALNDIPACSYNITPENPGVRGGGFQIPLAFEGKLSSQGSSCPRLKVNGEKDQRNNINTSCEISKNHCCDVFLKNQDHSNTTEEDQVKESLVRPPDKG